MTLETWAREHLSIHTRNKIGVYRVGARRLVSPAFSLPSLIVIGTQRGGTSALYKYLSAHPRLRPSIRKEVQYFTRYYDKGLDWYRANFAPRWRSGSSFEATPDYLFHPRAPNRALETFGDRDIRFVVLLRNPVDRAVSQFLHRKRLGLELRSPEEALLDPRSTLPVSDITDDSNRDVFTHSYISRGYYDQQLTRWVGVFPRDRFLIIQSEHFFSDTPSVLATIHRFAGVEEIWPGYVDYGYARSSDFELPHRVQSKLVDLCSSVAPALHSMGIDVDWGM